MRFNYLSAKTFTRQEEHSTTGADFELELWVVGKRFSVPLLFQAKKFVKPYDSYVRKLNYPNGTQAQLRTLLAYAAPKRRLPFYAIYTDGNSTARPMCGGRTDVETGVYMVDAAHVKECADRKYGRRISLDDLLRRSNPFHCMFCCPMGREGRYFERYFSTDSSTAKHTSDELPNYVQRLLSADSTASFEQMPEELSFVKALAVYDLRREE